MLRTIRCSVFALLFLAAVTSGLETEGMVLLSTAEGEASKLILKYLSTGNEVILQDGRVVNACFSPDGRKVVYHHRMDPNAWDQVRKEMYTMDVDGSNRTKAMTSEGYTAPSIPNWCTNGYIYFATGKYVRRVPENGGPQEVVYTATEGTPTPLGGYVSPALGGDVQVSLDGTRCVGTVQNWTADSSKAGWAQLLVRIDLQEQYCLVRPCQAGMAPSGNRMSVSQHAHRIYRIYDWDIPFVDYGEDGNSFEGCTQGQFESTKMCPQELDVILAAYDIRDALGLGTEWADLPEFSSPHWSNSDEDIFLVTDSRKETGAWVIRISTKEYTSVAPDGYKVHDFVATEILPTTAFTLTPSSTIINYNPGDAAPDARVATLASLAAMTAPTVTGAPAWLQVSTDLVDGNTCEISNTINLAQLPAEGSHTDTMTVVPGGSTDTLYYSVKLRVGPPAPQPIVIIEPEGGEAFAVGDTLHIVYDADSLEAPGTVVSMSLNDGEDWYILHTGESWGTGPGTVFDYVIPEEALVGASMVSTVSNTCQIRVTRYPDGLDAFSETFAIVASTGTALTRNHNRAIGLGVAVDNAARHPSLTINSPSYGTARLIDMRGRVVMSFAVRAGRHTVPIGTVEAGRYVFELRTESERLTEPLRVGF